MNDKKTQCKMILDYLEAHGSITAWEAMEQLHIMRLASRVHDLRKHGCNIVGKMVTNGNGKRFKVYRMEEVAA